MKYKLRPIEAWQWNGAPIGEQTLPSWLLGIETEQRADSLITPAGVMRRGDWLAGHNCRNMGIWTEDDFQSVFAPIQEHTRSEHTREEDRFVRGMPGHPDNEMGM